jgi:DDE superfamily endonuclease
LHLGNVDMEVANRVSGKLLFLRFVSFDLRRFEPCAVPTPRPGDIVSLDNLGSHKSKAVRDAIRAAGAKRIFLPAYSPDLNPMDPSARSGGLRQAETSHAKAGERTMRHGTASEPRSTTSRRKNTQTILGMQDMRHGKVITL